MLIGDVSRGSASSDRSRSSRSRSRATNQSRCSVSLESPGPRGSTVLGVFRQCLLAQRLDVLLVPAVGLVHALQHLLLARGHVVPALRCDLIRRWQVVLLVGVGTV